LSQGVAMKDWVCLCGRFVRERRFCPSCKLVRFTIENSPILDYWGLNVGEVSNGLPFNFPINYLTEHVLVTGQTGTGKTRFAMNLAVKAENYVSIHPKKLLVIDVEGEWKNIIPKMKKLTEYFAIDKNLKINPFDLGDPALIRELFRETVFKGIEKEYVDLSAQMNFVLQEAIHESHNMEELIKNIKNYSKQKLTALDKTKTALLVRLDPFMRSPLKEIFFCKKSNPDFNNLGDHNVIIDLHALDKLVAYGSELRLIYNTITTYFLRKMLNRGTCDWVENIFVADEAQLLVPKILHKIVVTESWPATEFATRLRKRGCGLVLITQSPSNIEKDIFKNVATKVAFRLQHQEDIKLIAEAAGFMDYTEYGYLSDRFVRLPRKNAIVVTSGHEPFLVTAADFEIENHNISPEIPEVEEEKIEESDPDEQIFLENVEREPFLSVTERRLKLGWRNEKYVKIVDELLQKRKIERVKVKLGKGSPKILYQTPGRVPSVKHEFYVNWIADYLKSRGFSCKKNSEGPDIEIPEIKTAIEVELGKSNMYGNIRNDSQKFDRVIICSDQKRVLEVLSNEIKDPKILFLQIQKIPAFFEKKTARNDLEDI
jgi:energy-coupling factor transporter ATP-binding protein EcfA2